MLAILDKPEVRLHALPISVSGYEKMGEFGEIAESTELIRGVIFEKMSKSPLHSGLIRLFIRAAASILEPGHFISSEQPLRLKDSCPEPDLAIIAGSEDDYMSKHPSTAQLVIEISISSEALDREKAAVYAEAGVPEYWIVLPEQRVTECFSKPVSGSYTEHEVVPAREICSSRVLSGLSVRLAEWLG
jgi:Uma2 family endonuclease